MFTALRWRVYWRILQPTFCSIFLFVIWFNRQDKWSLSHHVLRPCSVNKTASSSWSLCLCSSDANEMFPFHSVKLCTHKYGWFVVIYVSQIWGNFMSSINLHNLYNAISASWGWESPSSEMRIEIAWPKMFKSPVKAHSSGFTKVYVLTEAVKFSNEIADKCRLSDMTFSGMIFGVEIDLGWQLPDGCRQWSAVEAGNSTDNWYESHHVIILFQSIGNRPPETLPRLRVNSGVGVITEAFTGNQLVVLKVLCTSMWNM